ncbi:multicopper oxidase family protein [Limimaricola sp. G21655-S1]|uniref:multicopper oxidase family protein n=1 Tax=Limimaricola sp. G21655-S1 TaxID=3014768 RepID=UPI0022B02119|nr:multicopper oxidase family protein [Limimaricola sp. G21655-S1]MCZ4260090.1 multicopper oxidase family protein [Limimaricola sp. G21655-S1]
MTHRTSLSRRGFLAGAAALSGAAFLPKVVAAGPQFELTAMRAQAQLLAPPRLATPVWSYGGGLPGPVLRFKQGDRLSLRARNDLDRPTSIHWHGLRVPNAMDGVAHLTQPPIGPGEDFLYEFDLPDAGTYWYHPHMGGAEQVGRGLTGALIVEEETPIRVDRDLVWMLQDWRLEPSGEIVPGFDSPHDAMHGGRIGNHVTLNGQPMPRIEIAPNERLRIRIINAATARIFALDFGPLAPTVVALDGQPVAPHAPEGGVVLIGPGMRADIVLDASGGAGAAVPVRDLFRPDGAYDLATLAHGDTPLRANAPDWDMALAPNPLPEPNLTAATRHEVVFNGGMMGQMMMGDEAPAMTEQMRQGRMWFVNGRASDGHDGPPLIEAKRGSTQLIAMENRTGWWHPIHLHGHVFRVISRDGKPTMHREWRDTVLMAPEERVEIAFRANNPGDWMLHCHVLAHQSAGMAALIRVADAA